MVQLMKLILAVCCVVRVDLFRDGPVDKAVGWLYIV